MQEEELLIAQNATEEIERLLRKSLLQSTEKETELKEKKDRKSTRLNSSHRR